MRKFKVFASYLLSATFLLGVTSCDNDTDFEGDNTPANAPYVVCLGITSNSATSYYVAPVIRELNRMDIVRSKSATILSSVSEDWG